MGEVPEKGSTRDSSTAQADPFADERGEKASACLGRNDRWKWFYDSEGLMRVVVCDRNDCWEEVHGWNEGDWERETFEMFVN